MNKTLRFFMAVLPLFIFIGVLFFLWRGLSLKPEILPSALLGKPVPHFRLGDLMTPAYPLTEENFKGQVTLLNIWASWCASCEMEHAMLMEIKKSKVVPIYGIVYKDNPKNTQTFLNLLGNPYSRIGNDNSGAVAMDFGVYGTPESFLIDKNGIIVYRHVGVIDRQVWDNELLPLIRRLL